MGGEAFAVILRGKEAEAFLRQMGMLDSKERKYHNERVFLDGIRFDSKKEAERYSYLKMLERIGEIEQLELQKKFVLVPTQRNKAGKVTERAITYRADFYYYSNRLGRYVVEDAKGVKTDVYKMKKKLMLAVHGLEIVEV